MDLLPLPFLKRESKIYLMEKELVTFVVLILVVIFMLTIIFKIIPLLYPPKNTSQEMIPSSASIKKEYREIIEKTKFDYENFKRKNP